MPEPLLVIFVVALVAVAVLAVTTLSGTALRVVAAFFAAPLRPPASLSRLVAMVELEVAEREAAEAARNAQGPPPPEIVLALRGAAHPERPPESLARIAALVEEEQERRRSAAPAKGAEPPEIVLALRAAAGPRPDRDRHQHRPGRWSAHGIRTMLARRTQQAGGRSAPGVDASGASTRHPRERSETGEVRQAAA